MFTGLPLVLWELYNYGYIYTQLPGTREPSLARVVELSGLVDNTDPRSILCGVREYSEITSSLNSPIYSVNVDSREWTCLPTLILSPSGGGSQSEDTDSLYVIPTYCMHLV